MWKNLSRVNPFSPDIYLCGVCLAFTSSPWNTFMRRSGCVTLHSFWEKKAAGTHTRIHTCTLKTLCSSLKANSALIYVRQAWRCLGWKMPTCSYTLHLCSQCLLAPCRPAQNLSVTLSSPAILKWFYWCLDLDITLDIKESNRNKVLQIKLPWLASSTYMCTGWIENKTENPK